MSNTNLSKHSNLDRQSLFSALQATTGRDYSPYLFEPFERAVTLRLEQCDQDIDAYLERLAQDRDEARYIEGRALVGVSVFFRSPQTYEALEGRIESLLLNQSSPDTPMAIWVPACSTGEEAYSLAMLCTEVLSNSNHRRPLRIAATDISEKHLEQARRGIYEERKMRNIPRQLRERYFSDRRIHPELRKSVLIFNHDLFTPSPFSDLDLVSCRNLLIYLRPSYQRLVLSTLASALKVGGLLLIGASENIPADNAEFAPVSRRHRIFERTDGAP